MKKSKMSSAKEEMAEGEVEDKGETKREENAEAKTEKGLAKTRKGAKRSGMTDVEKMTAMIKARQSK